MALPRPALLAVAGAMLSMLSFTVMRTIGAESAGDLPVPSPAGQTADTGAPKAKQPAAKPAPEPKLEGVPAPVANALASGKVVVILFGERAAADDAATAANYGALAGLDGVRAFRAGIADVPRYAGIVAQVGVTQAPAAVIVRPDLTAMPPIEGYVDSQYLVQRVKDQLR